jgi:hypothetical protein
MLNVTLVKASFSSEILAISYLTPFLYLCINVHKRNDNKSDERTVLTKFIFLQFCEINIKAVLALPLGMF